MLPSLAAAASQAIYEEMLAKGEQDAPRADCEAPEAAADLEARSTGADAQATAAAQAVLATAAAAVALAESRQTIRQEEKRLKRSHQPNAMAGRIMATHGRGSFGHLNAIQQKPQQNYPQCQHLSLQS